MYIVEYLKMNKYYIQHIYKRIIDLKNAGKSAETYDNYDLSKIFEYYACIELEKLYNTAFYCYEDIDPDFKEKRGMSYNDTGIDLSDLKETIVQCKLRKESTTYTDCATFLASQNTYNIEKDEPEIQWKKMILCRNSDIRVSRELTNKIKSKILLDISFNRQSLIKYCEKLIENPKLYTDITEYNICLRDYQCESIELIRNTQSNVIINLPTGTGKNIVIIHSLEEGKKYLILVPRIILMEQLKEEIIKYRPTFTDTIQTIGDGKDSYDIYKNITICVYNSISCVCAYLGEFNKIYIDEAHNIREPSIYITPYVENYEESQQSYIDDGEYYEGEIEDDNEDELKKSKFMKIISEMTKYNNNIYLSATIDRLDGFTYYKRDIREMIESGYLCDYTLNIPIFSNDPTSQNICSYLVRNYRNTIIYCHSQKEGKRINNLMNKLMPNCSRYIDCHTKKVERSKIISIYKSGEIPFLVNVRILTEGFDASITKSVCFLHLPSNQTQVIQIIGRSLRLHPDKKYASVILPASSNEDCNTINHFIKINQNVKLT